MSHMSEIQIHNYYELPPAAGGLPEQLVILLHGLGSNGRDLLSLAPFWAKSLPRAQFVSPDAPFPLDMMPGMSDAYQWFSLSDRAPEKMRAGAERAAPILESFLQSMRKKYGVPPGKTALVGFSQGTMMSLYLLPRLPEKIAGVLGYSGALIGGEDLLETPREFQHIPVCLIHGEADDVVPVQARAHAEKLLEKAGFPVSGFTIPALSHGIDETGIDKGGEFLDKILDAKE